MRRATEESAKTGPGRAGRSDSQFCRCLEFFTATGFCAFAAKSRFLNASAAVRRRLFWNAVCLIEGAVPLGGQVLAP